MKYVSTLLGLMLSLSVLPSYAAPVLYEFTATYSNETRGNPLLDSFTAVSDPGQLLYNSGVVVTGSFIYDSAASVSVIPVDTGLSFSGTGFTANLQGDTASDNNIATLILDNTNYGTEDFLGLYVDPPVGTPLPNELIGFDKNTASSGEIFGLYNFRFLWLQGSGSDFIDGLLNPLALPPTGHDGVTRLAVDFLLRDAQGSLDETVQQIVFFDNVEVTSVSNVPIPASLVLFLGGLPALLLSRKI